MLKFHPEKVVLPDTAIGATARVDCRIANEGNATVGLDELNSDNPAFHVELTNNAIAARSQATFRISFTPRVEGASQALIIAAAPEGPVAYLPVRGTGKPAREKPGQRDSSASGSADPKYLSNDPAPNFLDDPAAQFFEPPPFGPVQDPGQSAQPPHVGTGGVGAAGKAFGQEILSGVNWVGQELQAGAHALLRPRLKPLVATPKTLEFTTSPGHDPVPRPIRLENPNDQSVDVDLMWSLNDQSAAFFVDNRHVRINAHSKLDTPITAFFLPQKEGNYNLTVQLRQSAASFPPQEQTVELKGHAIVGAVTEQLPSGPTLSENLPEVQKLPDFAAKNWSEASALLLRAKQTVSNLDPAYKRWVPVQHATALDFRQRYIDAIKQFEGELQDLLTEENVSTLLSLMPDDTTSVASFLLDFVGLVPVGGMALTVFGIVKDAIFLAFSMWDNHVTRENIKKAIAKARLTGTAVSNAITSETEKAVKAMSDGFAKMSTGEGAWREQASEANLFAKYEEEANRSKSVAKAKDAYGEAVKLLDRFSTARDGVASGLHDIARDSIQIGGELDEVYLKISQLVKGGAAPESEPYRSDRKRVTLEVTVDPTGPTEHEIRDLLVFYDFKINSVDSKAWQQTDAYNRRRELDFNLEWQAIKSMNAMGILHRMTKQLRALKGVVSISSEGLQSL